MNIILGLRTRTVSHFSFLLFKKKQVACLFWKLTRKTQSIVLKNSLPCNVTLCKQDTCVTRGLTTAMNMSKRQAPQNQQNRCSVTTLDNYNWIFYALWAVLIKDIKQIGTHLFLWFFWSRIHVIKNVPRR